MCLGNIARLNEVWEEDGVRLARTQDGAQVTLSYLPDAQAGDYVLLHLGIPVEVLSEERAQDALGLRADMEEGGSE